MIMFFLTADCNVWRMRQLIIMQRKRHHADFRQKTQKMFHYTQNFKYKIEEIMFNVQRKYFTYFTYKFLLSYFAKIEVLLFITYLYKKYHITHLSKVIE